MQLQFGGGSGLHEKPCHWLFIEKVLSALLNSRIRRNLSKVPVLWETQDHAQIVDMAHEKEINAKRVPKGVFHQLK